MNAAVKIAKIEEVIDPSENTNDIIIDAKGAWVLPGLILIVISEFRKRKRDRLTTIPMNVTIPSRL